MTAISMSRWYVVHTHANAEAKAALNLQRQNFEIYLPRYLKRRRHARRVEIVPAPLFPRYLFVAIDTAAQRWRAIQSTIGVVQLVKCGECAVSVRYEVIEGLRCRADEQGYIQLDRSPRYTPGDKVRIVDGAFSAALGLIESVTDGERVAILLDLLGRKVRVVLDVAMIEAA